MRLHDIKQGMRLRGVVPGETVEIESVSPYSAAMTKIIFSRTDGNLTPRVISEQEATGFTPDETALAWMFDADPAKVRLASEAYRIKLAHLFDPHLAIHTSRIDPLPHQISAVYQEMLPRQPLRFLLADDPGAGKTIMTGLLIKELLIRGDLRRCLIVCPGSLTEQWQEELEQKFQLEFEILGSIRTVTTTNPFEKMPLCIARMDVLKANTHLQEQLRLIPWDLIVCDEAHKMSASSFGDKENITKRYALGIVLRDITRHFLLLSATPHNGKDEDFQLFLRLLDKDRFAGRYRPGVDVSDLMRRLLKEDLYTFERKRLFPDRYAETRRYILSPAEKELYDEVTAYVREGFNRADEILQPDKRHAIGFALTILQRRLASSPEAIYQSLRRRRERLETRLQELRRHPELLLGDDDPQLSDEELEDLLDLPEEELAATENKLLDRATAARTVAEIAIEVEQLKELEELARRLRNSGADAKWAELSEMLQSKELQLAEGVPHKLIIFTEHRDTLDYLVRCIGGTLRNPDAVVTIHGGLSRQARRRVEEEFRNNQDISVLVATDAAGEGINLQCAHLMINYDLPWNPNRIEQRFGRIHRIGQKHPCFLWNLVADETREGEVFARLFEKLNIARNALGDKVYNVLGDLRIGGKSLKDLLIEAVRCGNDPRRSAEILAQIDVLEQNETLYGLIDEKALAHDVLGLEQVKLISEERERIEALRLQPHHIKSFFQGAYENLNGRMNRLGDGRYTLPFVPGALREQRTPQGTIYPLAQKYEAITFEKEKIRLEDQIDRQLPDAVLICPGHPLLSALIDHSLQHGMQLLRQGTILIDDASAESTDRLLFAIEDVLEDGRRDKLSGQPLKISHRLHYVELDASGKAQNAGIAPYVNYSIPTPEEMEICRRLLQQRNWWQGDAEGLARSYAADYLLPEHLEEVRQRRKAYVAKVRQQVEERLSAEIARLDTQIGKLWDQENQGVPTARASRVQEEGRKAEMERRRTERLYELELEDQVNPRPPLILGGAWIVPRELLNAAQGGDEDKFSADAAARAEIERIAMATVTEIEQRAGATVCDVSALKRGWDIESRRPDENEALYIEVKGRRRGATEIIVTRNEMTACINAPQRVLLAVVEIDDSTRSVTYLRHWVRREPEFAESARSLNLQRLRQDAEIIWEEEIKTP